MSWDVASGFYSSHGEFSSAPRCLFVISRAARGLESQCQCYLMDSSARHLPSSQMGQALCMPTEFCLASFSTQSKTLPLPQSNFRNSSILLYSAQWCSSLTPLVQLVKSIDSCKMQPMSLLKVWAQQLWLLFPKYNMHPWLPNESTWNSDIAVADGARRQVLAWSYLRCNTTIHIYQTGVKKNPR